ncbi:MAG: hypothetical protein M3442_06700 [Chloroflexota bacterium]|nr:hypothetical protein [Chloroflexota bacterium]
MILLPFGISDLNQRFDLLAEIERRRVADCTDWVRRRLPEWLGPFAYTGGERAYLRSQGVPLAGDRCDRADFERLADRLAGQPTAELERRSPFNPRWMRGAVASNCVVLAALAQSRASHFLASDFNICHGLIASL